ncbi:MAG: DUF294 nucleotidyltransferase-like domain-containing protein [Bacteroidota bacterium]|nr:DUF294 nucleotidyltransferase-like domain-containing protein [Bacteroidota bacterium]
MNPIARNIAEYLQEHPPFSLGSWEDCMALAKKSQVLYLIRDEVLFEKEAMPGEYFFVIRKGSIALKDGEILIDHCEEGDVLGVRPLIAGDQYRATAIAQQDSIVYALPVAVGKKMIAENPRISLYFAAGFASGSPGTRRVLAGKLSRSLNAEEGELGYSGLNQAIIMDGSKKVLTCLDDSTIRQAAIQMSAKGVGSIIVIDDQDRPVGIVTDRDLRNKVSTGRVPLESSVTTIMSHPVKTVPNGLTLADYSIEMLNLGVHHLCLTRDGTPDSEVVGVLSEHDLILAQGYNPAVIIKEIRRSSKMHEWQEMKTKSDDLHRQYLRQEVSMEYLTKMMTAIKNAIWERVIDHHADRIGLKKDAFCYLSLGSFARGEQLLTTDQDTALIIADNEIEKGRELAQTVENTLHELGWPRDEAGISANSTNWNRTLKEWKVLFSQWIDQPDPDNILRTTIFFDFRAVSGNLNWSGQLTKHIFLELEKTQLFLPYLAQDAVETPPPLGFFRNLIVERSGEHKNEFDLKLRALLPLVDTARVLALQHQMTGMNNTVERFKEAARLEPDHAELFNEAGKAFAFLNRIRAWSGMKHNDSGRFVDPEALSRLESQSLRNTFSTIHELQKMLKVRFRLSLLR